MTNQRSENNHLAHPNRPTLSGVMWGAGREELSATTNKIFLRKTTDQSQAKKFCLASNPCEEDLMAATEF